MPLRPLLVLAAILSCAHAQPPPEPTAGAIQVRQRPPGEPVRVFFTTRSMGYRHEVLPQARQVLADADARHDWVAFEITDDIDPIAGRNLADTLARIDVLVLYTTGRLPLDTTALARWVEAGGALVGVHSATDTLADDGTFVRLIGGTFDGHPWNEEVTLRIDDPEHPAMRPFAREAMETAPPTFRFADEIYQFKSLAPDRRVILSLAPGHSKMEPGREYPLAWTRRPGKGRVFYTALGHRPEVWRDPRFVEHLLEGIRWAAGEEERKKPSLETDPSSAGPAALEHPLDEAHAPSPVVDRRE